MNLGRLPDIHADSLRARNLIKQLPNFIEDANLRITLSPADPLDGDLRYAHVNSNILFRFATDVPEGILSWWGNTEASFRMLLREDTSEPERFNVIKLGMFLFSRSPDSGNAEETIEWSLNPESEETGEPSCILIETNNNEQKGNRWVVQVSTSKWSTCFHFNRTGRKY